MKWADHRKRPKRIEKKLRKRHFARHYCDAQLALLKINIVLLMMTAIDDDIDDMIAPEYKRDTTQPDPSRMFKLSNAEVLVAAALCRFK